MRFAALATDYDGTLAHDGLVSPAVIDALRQLRSSGRRVILVTGRTLESLATVFPALELFDRIVAENGSTIYNPATKTERILAEAPPEALFEALRRRGVSALEVGHVIVAMAESEKKKVLDAIRETGLELQIIFNKGSLMVLPTGANKATGLQAAAEELGLSLRSIAGIGDAENDHAFLTASEFSAAVANALPALKQRVQLVTAGKDGAGVMELAQQMLKDDLSGTSAWLGQPLVLGQSEFEDKVTVPACSVNLLAGPSGAGKSTLAKAFLEALLSAGYQFCAIDPEGDYEEFEPALMLGTPQHPPSISEVIKALEKPSQSVVVNLLGLELEKRPNFFHSLLLRLQELRARTGRPHCLVVDEAHHFLSAELGEPKLFPPGSIWGILLITVRPDALPADFLRQVHMVAVTGEDAERTLRAFCSKVEYAPPSMDCDPEPGQMLAWRPESGAAVPFTPSETQAKRTRHRRKYAQGELSPERSFYFRGPAGKLNLRAGNLMSFLNLMEGVDDETWLYHLRKHDVSGWFELQIKDADLAREAEAIETARDINASESRERFRSLITERYTAPA